MSANRTCTHCIYIDTRDSIVADPEWRGLFSPGKPVKIKQYFCLRFGVSGIPVEIARGSINKTSGKFPFAVMPINNGPCGLEGKFFQPKEGDV